MVTFKLSEYKEKYETFKNEYLNKDDDFEEIDFIESELEKYNYCLLFLNSNKLLVFSIFIHPDRQFYTNDSSLINSIKDPYLKEGSNIFMEKRHLYLPLKEEILNSEKVTGSLDESISAKKIIFNKIIAFLNKKKSEIKNPQQISNSEEIKSSENIECSFINNFDNVDNFKVYNYFKKELVDKNYLSLENLEIYLKLSFEKNELPKAKFIFKKNKTLKTIRVVFYEYYKNIAYKPNGEQTKYIKLLTNYFQGFEFEKVKNNFNK
jgi:hypothetical protein